MIYIVKVENEHDEEIDNEKAIQLALKMQVRIDFSLFVSLNHLTSICFFKVPLLSVFERLALSKNVDTRDRALLCLHQVTLLRILWIVIYEFVNCIYEFVNRNLWIFKKLLGFGIIWRYSSNWRVKMNLVFYHFDKQKN